MIEEVEQKKANQFKAYIDNDKVLSDAVVSIGSYGLTGSIEIMFADDVANVVRTKLIALQQEKAIVNLSVGYLDAEGNVRATTHFKDAKCHNIEFDSVGAESDYDLVVSTTFSFESIENITNELE